MSDFGPSIRQIARLSFDPNRESIKTVPFENEDNLYYIFERVNSSVLFEGWTEDNGDDTNPPAQGSAIWKIRLTINNGSASGYEVWATTASEVLFDKVWDDKDDYFPAINLDEQYSRDYDGINDRDNGSDIFLYDRADAFTVSFWVKINNTAAQRAFFSKSTADASVNGIGFYHNSSGKLFLQMRTSSTKRAFTYNSTLPTTTWTHIVLAYDGGSNINGALAYINAAVESTPSSGSLSSTFLLNQDFLIGARGSSFNFSGRIARFLVWDKQLSQAEITELYNSGVLADPTTHSAAANLINRWRMGDGDTFNTISDNKGSDDLTMENSTADDFVLDVP